jgi:uncharacterized RDD family membrane protein YckC
MNDAAGGLAAQVDLGRDRAGFWRRFVAALIDAVVLSVAGSILTLFGIGHNEHGVRVFLAGGNWPAILLSLVYFTFFHGRTGQSPGDAALGVKVIDLREGTGGPIGYPRAALRWLVSIASGVALLIGYLWMLWDDEQQTWHDKAAGSVVVKLDS